MDELTRCITEGDLKQIKQILNDVPNKYKVLYSNNNKYIIDVVKNNHLNILKYFVEDLFIDMRFNRDLLFRIAIKNANLPIIEYLIDEYQIKVTLNDVRVLIISDCKNILNYMFEKSIISPRGLFRTAMSCGNCDMVKYLLEKTNETYTLNSSDHEKIISNNSLDILQYMMSNDNIKCNIAYNKYSQYSSYIDKSNVLSLIKTNNYDLFIIYVSDKRITLQRDELENCISQLVDLSYDIITHIIMNFNVADYKKTSGPICYLDTDSLAGVFFRRVLEIDDVQIYNRMIVEYKLHNTDTDILSRVINYGSIGILKLLPDCYFNNYNTWRAVRSAILTACDNRKYNILKYLLTKFGVRFHMLEILPHEIFAITIDNHIEVLDFAKHICNMDNFNFKKNKISLIKRMRYKLTKDEMYKIKQINHGIFYDIWKYYKN